MLRDVVPGSVVTVAVTVDRHRPPPPNRPRSPYLIYASDDTGDVVITYFNARKDYIDRLLPVGQRRIVSGTMAMYDGMLQMVHPDFVVAEAELANMPAIQPVYPLTEGLTAQALRRTIGAAVEKVPPLPEWLDPPLVAREKWPSFADALRTLHRPAEPADLSWQGPAWSRLAYDEMLAGQLALALVRAHMGRRGGRAREHKARPPGADHRGAAVQAHRAARSRRSPTSMPISPRRSACCACSRATSAPARRSSRCSLPPG